VDAQAKTTAGSLHRICTRMAVGVLLAFLAFCAWSPLANAAISVIGSQQTVTQAQIQQSLLNNGATPSMAAAAASLSSSVEDRGGTLGIYNGSCCTGVLQVNQSNLAAYCNCTSQQYANMSLDQQTAVWMTVNNASSGAASVKQLQSMEASGQTLGGQTVDDAMILSCQQLGAGHCAQTIAYAQSTGSCASGKGVPGADGNGTSICSMASQIDANGGTSSSTTTTSTTQNGVTTNTTTTTISGVYCDPAIQAQITDAGRSMVDNWTTLASSPGTGYSLLGGQSVLEAAGLMQPGSQGYVGSSGLFGSQGGTYGQASCLNNLLGNGINIIFSPPTLDSLLNMLMQAACHEVQSLVSQAIQPLSQSVYQAFSLNGLVPGLNLGSLGGSAGISVGPSSSGGLLNIGTPGSTLSYSPNSGWYQSNQGSTASYGSIFGSQSSSGGTSSSSLFGGLF
jgi:hypothetical protein